MNAFDMPSNNHCIPGRMRKYVNNKVKVRKKFFIIAKMKVAT